jgi:anti-sigma regulatory factor (Ser/Thr protein kinase)
VVPAGETQVPVVRDRLHEWLTTVAVDSSRAQDILLAAGEAVTNGIEHGSHCDPRRTVSLEAFIRGTTIAITVADSGRWSGDSSASLRSSRRGRGLTLMSGLADRVDTVRDRWGTRVTMVFDHAVPG